MKKKNRNLIIIVCLIIFNFFPLINIQQVQGAFDPRPEGGIYSHEEWGLYIQVVYGSLEGHSVLIPQNARVLPNPTFYLIASIPERNGERDFYLALYDYNETTQEYTTFIDNMTINMKMGDGGDEFFAQKKISFKSYTDKMKCVLHYLDIDIEFIYELNPYYKRVMTSYFDTQTTLLLWVLITCLVIVSSDLPARKLQRRVAVVPGFPIMTTILFSLSFIFMIVTYTLQQYPYGWQEKIIYFILGIEIWLLLIPIFLVSTLWLAHRHTTDSLRILQLDFSSFKEVIPSSSNLNNNKENDTETNLQKRRKIVWTKDINMDHRVYEKKSKLYMCDPNSWTQFFWRLLGFHILMINHEQSMKPDHGVWLRNDQREYVSIKGFNLKREGWGLRSEPNFKNDGFIKTISVFCLGAIPILLSGLKIISGVFGVLAVFFGVIICISAFFIPGSIINLKYQSLVWDFDVIKYREAELILTQHEQFLDLQHQINELEQENLSWKTRFGLEVKHRVRAYVNKINLILGRIPYIWKFFDKEGVAPPEEYFEKKEVKEKIEKESKEKIEKLKNKQEIGGLNG